MSIDTEIGAHARPGHNLPRENEDWQFDREARFALALSDYFEPASKARRYFNTTDVLIAAAFQSDIREALLQRGVRLPPRHRCRADRDDWQTGARRDEVEAALRRILGQRFHDRDLVLIRHWDREWGWQFRFIVPAEPLAEVA